MEGRERRGIRISEPISLANGEKGSLWVLATRLWQFPAFRNLKLGKVAGHVLRNWAVWT